MKMSKAYAVFFTLLFFASVGQTLYLFLGGAATLLLVLALLITGCFLFLAIRYWRTTFRKDD